MELGQFTKDGQMNIEFNQPLDVPEFMLKSERRALLGKNSVDMTKIIGLEFTVQSDVNPKKLQYYIEIIEWTTQNLKLKFNFADTSKISQGLMNDKMSIQIKNPTYFASSLSGETYKAPKEDLSGLSLSVCP